MSTHQLLESDEITALGNISNLSTQDFGGEQVKSNPPLSSIPSLNISNNLEEGLVRSIAPPLPSMHQLDISNFDNNQIPIIITKDAPIQPHPLDTPLKASRNTPNESLGFGKIQNNKKIFQTKVKKPYAKKEKNFINYNSIYANEKMPPKPSSMAKLTEYIQKSIQWQANKLNVRMVFDSTQYDIGNAILTIATKLVRQFLLEIKVNDIGTVTFNIYNVFEGHTRFYTIQHTWQTLCKSKDYREINAISTIICNAFIQRIENLKRKITYKQSNNSSVQQSALQSPPPSYRSSSHRSPSPSYRSSSHRSPSPSYRSSSHRSPSPSYRSSSHRSPSPRSRQLSYNPSDERYTHAAASGRPYLLDERYTHAPASGRQLSYNQSDERYTHAAVSRPYVPAPQPTSAYSNNQTNMMEIVQQMTGLQRKLGEILANQSH
jgi:hypothetical protein